MSSPTHHQIDPAAARRTKARRQLKSIEQMMADNATKRTAALPSRQLQAIANSENPISIVQVNFNGGRSVKKYASSQGCRRFFAEWRLRLLRVEWRLNRVTLETHAWI